MNSRVHGVSVAMLALLTVASACLAAEPSGPDSTGARSDSLGSSSPALPTPEPAVPTPAAPTPSAPAPTTATRAPADTRGDHPGYGGVGGQFGLSDVPEAGDYSRFAQPRMSFAGTWRYTFTPSLRWQVSPGFLWTAYTKKSNPAPFRDIHFPTDPYKDRYLTLVAPISAELQWVQRGHKLMFHLGAGPGLYRVWVENHRKVVVDPVTLKPHRGLYPGATFEVGVERFMKTLPTTSVELTLDGHYIAARRDQQFPSGFNDKLTAFGLRVGVNYYFNLRAKPKKQEPELPGIK